MKIAYVCADSGIPLLGAKGASVHVREITAALARRGHIVHVLCARMGDGNPKPRVTSVRHCDTPKRLDDALRDLAQDELDIVIERYSLESGTARRTSRALSVPLVLEVNAPLVLEAVRWRGLSNSEHRLVAERDTFRSADAVIAVSNALVHYVSREAPGATVRHIPNGADVEPFARAGAERGPANDHEVVIGFAGSMKPWHGVDHLIDSFARLRERHRQARLVLVGHGPQEPELRERVAADAQIRRFVQFVGAVPHREMPHILAGFEIGVAPYRDTQDFYFSPLKIVEYLASGLPVVYPNIGDLPALVGGGGIGYDPADRDALLGALTTLVRDAGLRQRCASAAARHAAGLSWNATAEKVEALMTSVMDSSTRMSQ